MSCGRKSRTQLRSFGPHVVSGFEPRPCTKMMLDAGQYAFSVAGCVDLLDPVSACRFVGRTERVSSDKARRAPRRLFRLQSRRDPLCQLVVEHGH
jgi:hypothetical protein